MPGLTLVHDDPGCRPADATVVATAASATPLAADDVRTLHSSPELLVVAAVYPGYPVAHLDDGRHHVVLEGRIYATRTGRHEGDLLRLARALLTEPDPDATAARWLAGVDGEFVLVAFDAHTGTGIVLTDRYGRLPLHHGSCRGRTVVSRDPRVAAALVDRQRLSRTSIAHFLLFGHPLGSDTLFESVRRTPPACRITFPGGDCRGLLSQDFEAALWGADRDAAPAIADALVEACERRTASDAAVVVSLSGGVDSRLVAGALARAGRRPSAVTHVDVAGHDADEAEAAGEVARALDMPWQPFAAQPPTGDEVARLLRLKGGANYLGMSRVLPFLDAVAARFGRDIVFFTGDLGDRVLGPVAPPVRLREPADVARYLLQRETILPLDEVAAATGTVAGALQDDLVARVAAYPERDGRLRYLRFMLGERGYRWAFEGEDRNRCWFWSTTPFFAPDVFERAVAVPPARKALHRLRIDTLRRLAPRLASVVDVSTQARVTSPLFGIRQRLRRFSRGAAYRLFGGGAEARMRRLLGAAPGYRPESPVLALIRAQLEHPAVGAYLEPGAVCRILDGARRVPREQFSVLYTVTSVIQTLEPEVVPALERFRALTFV